MSLTPVYMCAVSHPGYLPMTDGPAFASAPQAWGWLLTQRCADEEADESVAEYSLGVALLQLLATDGYRYGGHPDTEVTYSTHPDGAGYVWLGTPGYEGSHDVGLVYRVDVVPHDASPHEAGGLYDCPACAVMCHCVPGGAECVYEGDHDGV